MSVNFKTLTREGISSNYGDRHGFLFISSVSPSNESVNRLCDSLISSGITSVYPECVCRFEGGNMGKTTVFIYPEGESFASGPFYKTSVKFMMMVNCKIEMLFYYIKMTENPKK